jgi:hypothetical protein
MSPTVQSLGFPWFVRYASILVLAHHVALFWIESFRFGDLLFATARSLASSVFTVLLVLISQFLTSRSK